MKSYRINFYSTFNTLKASIVERFNRTLKEIMWREFSFNGKYKWIDMYKQLINKYNNRVASKFRKGDHVRNSRYIHVFEKG